MKITRELSTKTISFITFLCLIINTALADTDTLNIDTNGRVVNTGNIIFTNKLLLSNPSNNITGVFSGNLNGNASSATVSTTTLNPPAGVVLTNQVLLTTNIITFITTGSGLSVIMTTNNGGITVNISAPTLLMTNGNGGNVTNLNATQLLMGTVPMSRLSTMIITNTETGITLAGSFAGDASALTNGAYANTNLTNLGSISSFSAVVVNLSTLAVPYSTLIFRATNAFSGFIFGPISTSSGTNLFLPLVYTNGL